MRLSSPAPMATKYELCWDGLRLSNSPCRSWRALWNRFPGQSERSMLFISRRWTLSRSHESLACFSCPLLFAPCSSLSNHPIRPKKHRLWNRDPDLLGCLKIDNHLELRRSLDGNVSRLGAFEYLVHVTRCAPIRLGKARTVGHEQARVGILFQSTYRRQAALERKIRDQSG